MTGRKVPQHTYRSFLTFLDREHSGSVVEGLTEDRGAAGRDSSASLCCDIEQDTFILA